VFSDLDGTLLDHDTYEWAPAGPALVRLKHLNVPLVLASSKTAPEIAVVQRDMGLIGLPGIVENGAGVVGIGTGTETAGADYGAIRQSLGGLPLELRKKFVGFGDMGVEGVMEASGLSREQASLACARSFSEPGLWTGTDEQKQNFLFLLSEQGISARQGGRFLTLSFGKTKAGAMAQVAAHYNAPRTIALGDAPNDVEMLEAADVGVIVANPHHAPLPTLAGEAKGRILRTALPGPEGWNKAVLELVAHFTREDKKG
jgi:mannosyl-3-phosphoglycerate phosphatase